jgi:3-hydroxy-9,10-secoandrosta-1,3,5(10)-triene-9,17-dione monooxygenase reductase component
MLMQAEMPQTVVEPRTLRSALGKFATGVAVVTVRTVDGDPLGMTVNSFSSVSLDPPLVLFCVNRDSRLYSAFTNTAEFAVNILTEVQQDLSRRFARPGLDRFGTLPHSTGYSGVPVLSGSLAVVECITDSVVAAGDHAIVVGRVVAVFAETDRNAQPLVYFHGAYCRLDTANTNWWTAFS